MYHTSPCISEWIFTLMLMILFLPVFWFIWMGEFTASSGHEEYVHFSSSTSSISDGGSSDQCDEQLRNSNPLSSNCWQPGTMKCLQLFYVLPKMRLFFYCYGWTTVTSHTRLFIISSPLFCVIVRGFDSIELAVWLIFW